MTKPTKILLGQLNSYGDCLFATTVARQIKKDYPDCHLTWAIGSMCRSILDGNPHVDDVWEIPLENMSEVAATWPRFETDALDRKKRGDFDEIFLTQIAPGNLQNYDGNIRSSIFRAYPRVITVPVAPILRLSNLEKENVRRFAENHCLNKKRNVILFECSPKSQQSFVTPEFAMQVSQKLIANQKDICVILSSNIQIHTNSKRIIDGSELSFRENAELTKYCTLFIGCSSGISWLCTSDAAKPLPMVQLVSAKAHWFASFTHDFQYWGLSTDTIIEKSDCGSDELVDCVNTIFSHDFKQAKLKFHESLPVSYMGFKRIFGTLLHQRSYRGASGFVTMYFKKYGFDSRLVFNLASGLYTYVVSRIRAKFSNAS